MEKLEIEAGAEIRKADPREGLAWMLLAMCCALPVTNAVIRYFTIITFMKAAAAIAIAAGLVAALRLLYIESQGKIMDEIRPMHWALVALAALNTLSTVFSVDILRSIVGTPSRFEGVFVLYSYYIIFISASLIKKPDDIKKIMLVWLVFALAQTLYAIPEHYLALHPPNSRIWYKIFKVAKRCYSFFGNANIYGSFLVLCLGITGGGFCFAKSAKRRYIMLAFAIIFSAVTVFTGTRSAWVGAVAVIFALALAAIVAKAGIMPFLRTVALCALMVGIFLGIDHFEKSSYTERIETTIDEVAENSLHAGAGRFYIWERVLGIIKKYPLLGSGVDTLARVFPREKELVIKIFGKDQIFDKAHNEYLQTAATSGIPALLVYLAFLAMVFFAAFRRVRSNPAFYAGFFAAFCGYAVQAFFNISVLQVAPFFWMIAGFAVSSAGIVGEDGMVEDGAQNSA